jgi:hypothetical protein
MDERVFMEPNLFEFSHPSAEKSPNISPRKNSEYSPPMASKKLKEGGLMY